jgi:hypothetical protein
MRQCGPEGSAMTPRAAQKSMEIHGNPRSLTFDVKWMQSTCMRQAYDHERLRRAAVVEV